MKTSEILFWLSIIIVFIPVVSQQVIGKRLVRKNKSTAFNWLYGVNIFLQFIVTGLSFIIQGESFYNKAVENDWGEPPFNIPAPVVGFPISFVLGISLLVMGYNQMKKIDAKKPLTNN
jgi:hypothetical protein